MLKVIKSGPNVTVIETDDYVVLVSYTTPVAFKVKGVETYYRTSTKHSVTTTKHINKFLDGRDAEEVSQSEVNYVLGY